MTVADLLAAELRRDGARPFLTWYDDATGERVELSVATIANWAAKTANLLADEHGVEPGDCVSVEPVDHWLSVVVVLGAWTLGACVDVDADADAEIVMPGEPRAFMAGVLPQPDALLVPPAPASALALRARGREWSASELVAAAHSAVQSHALPAGARVLSTLALDSVTGLDAGVLVPLAAQGSVVLVANAVATKLADRAQVERVTHTAGIDLDGLPRLDAR